MVEDEVQAIEEVVPLFREGEVGEGVEEGLAESLFGLEGPGGFVIFDGVFEDEEVQFDLDGQLDFIFERGVALQL